LASAHLQDFLRATAAKTPGNVESSVTFPVAKRSRFRKSGGGRKPMRLQGSLAGALHVNW